MRRAEIGPYRLLRLIKRGGGGSVYAAHDQRLNRRVALKLIKVPQERVQRERVIAEAHALGCLNHRSIVQIFDVVETRSRVALVMEYVPGTDLESLLGLTRLDLAATLQLALDVCAALAACHQSGIVHRDLKPANILLDPQGHVKLTDFGIALTLEESGQRESTLDSTVPGSYLAMSPEHASGGRMDERSDLFALGLVMYRLLSGEHPFAGAANELVLLQQVVHRSHLSLVEKTPGIPPELSALVDSLLDKAPEQRPASALAVRQQVLAIMRDQAVPRGNSLLEVVASRSREEDRVETEIVLPENFSRGARSRFQSATEWGLWAGGGLSGLRRAALLCVGLLIVLTGYGTVRMLEGQIRPVLVMPPLVLGMDVAGGNRDQHALRSMLEDLVIADTALGLASDGVDVVDRLHLQVNCNTFLCGLLLRRDRGSESISDYRTVLPDAPLLAWQAQLRESLAELYPK